MGIYEVGVYLVIIVVASVCVFGIMWLLMRSMTPKRPRARKRASLAAVNAGGIPKQLPQPSGDTGRDKKNKKNKKEKNKKAPKVREEKLLKLKELPDNRLLAESEADGSSKNKAKETKKKPEDESQEMPPVSAGGESEESSSPEASADTAGQENAGLDLPDLPSLDTLTTEDEAPKEEEIDLMSVFEAEESEDSSTSDLAANLFDVDLENIEKLGSEVSDFLNGMRSR